MAIVGPSAAREQLIAAVQYDGVDLLLVEGLDELVQACVDHPPSEVILVASESMPAWSGALAVMREHIPDARVVLVCNSIDGWEVRAALAAGAVGIVLADVASAALGPCLAAARADHVCVPRASRRTLSRPVLSAREKQILGLVVMGYMNSQIAQQLFLAESTVKSHLSSAFVKLGVRSRHQAVDLILDPERGLDLGILALGGEPVGAQPGARIVRSQHGRAAVEDAVGVSS
jgi:DNA-binding NarL/FixJ family response regulator